MVKLLKFQNYNKSRIHSFRGARDVDITLDGKLIFRGEIARACGGIEGGTEAFGDVSRLVQSCMKETVLFFFKYIFSFFLLISRLCIFLHDFGFHLLTYC